MRKQLLKFGNLLIQLVCSNALVYLKCFILVADKLEVPRRMPLKPGEGVSRTMGACAGFALLPKGSSGFTLHPLRPMAGHVFRTLHLGGI